MSRHTLPAIQLSVSNPTFLYDGPHSEASRWTGDDPLKTAWRGSLSSVTQTYSSLTLTHTCFVTVRLNTISNAECLWLRTWRNTIWSSTFSTTSICRRLEIEQSTVHRTVHVVRGGIIVTNAGTFSGNHSAGDQGSSRRRWRVTSQPAGSQNGPGSMLQIITFQGKTEPYFKLC